MRNVTIFEEGEMDEMVSHLERMEADLGSLSNRIFADLEEKEKQLFTSLRTSLQQLQRKLTISE